METTPKPWTQVLYNSDRLGHLCLHTHSWVFNQLPTLYLLRKQSLSWPPSYLRDPDNTTHVYHQYHKSLISLSTLYKKAKTHTQCGWHANVTALSGFTASRTAHAAGLSEHPHRLYSRHLWEVQRKPLENISLTWSFILQDVMVITIPRYPLIYPAYLL